jgi:hypothetical protein
MADYRHQQPSWLLILVDPQQARQPPTRWRAGVSVQAAIQKLEVDAGSSAARDTQQHRRNAAE